MSGSAIDLSLVDVGKAYRRNASRRADTFWALQEISFDVPSGAALGIIGRNGAARARCSSCSPASRRQLAAGS